MKKIFFQNGQPKNLFKYLLRNGDYCYYIGKFSGKYCCVCESSDDLYILKYDNTGGYYLNNGKEHDFDIIKVVKLDKRG